SGYLPPFPHFATSAIHFAQEPQQWNSRAVVPPITLSTTFHQEKLGKNQLQEAGENKQEEAGDNQHYVYTRLGNPNRHILQEVVGTLDGAKSQGQRSDWKCLAAADGAKYCE
ncbi:CGL lyase, partial [Cisticola juncidis]|nr:CGL lyase [Cisticola juncidis]